MIKFVTGVTGLYTFDVLLLVLVLIICPCKYIIKDALDQISQKLEDNCLGNESIAEHIKCCLSHAIKFYKLVIT